MQFILALGKLISEAAVGAGYSLALLVRSLKWIGTAFGRRSRQEIFQQMYVCGIASIPVPILSKRSCSALPWKEPS